MTTTPETATFSIERDGQEYDVEVSRELIGTASSEDGPTDDPAAEWLQDNLAELSEIAHRKLDRLGSATSRIEITAEDWTAGRSG